MECRLRYSREWVVRLVHERQLHERASFVTLTYSDEFLPTTFSVSPAVVQRFMKRVRRWCGGGVRFFACGEYGGDGGRPHYHVLLFGADFSADRLLWRRTASGCYAYRSAALELLWPYGFAEVSDFTVQTAGYVARYVVKKVGGELAEAHYRRVHPLTGEVCQVRPEFVTMSLKPGIGQGGMSSLQGMRSPLISSSLTAVSIPSRDSTKSSWVRSMLCV